jgi:hypothetical protein
MFFYPRSEIEGVTLSENRYMEENMNRKIIGKSAWGGALAAAAFFMAPEAHATPWCPTASDHAIYCSNCSRELTCDVFNLTINIIGNGVILDGKDHWSTYANYGVESRGYGNTIRNLRIGNSFDYSIYLDNQTNTGLTTGIDNVYITGSSSYGIANNSVDPVAITNSTVTSSSYTNVNSWSTRSTDFRSSYSNHSNSSGYFGSGGGSWINASTFAYNGSYGLVATDSKNWLITGNTFASNSWRGLQLIDVSGSVQRNYGSGNTNIDCNESHTVPVSISHYGNSWGTHYGAGCSP